MVTIRQQIHANPELGPLLKTVTGQIEFSGIASHYESETSTFISGVGIEPASSLTLGALDRIMLGSDLSRIDGDWRVDGVRDTPGPTPITGPQDQPWDAEPFADSLEGFTRIDEEPAP